MFLQRQKAEAKLKPNAVAPMSVSSPNAKHQPAWTTALPLQPKLTVNQPGDQYEQEADQVAAQVMRMPTPTGQRCDCGGVAGPDGECAACKAKRLGLQRKADGIAHTEAPPSVHQTIHSSGQPLDSSTRAFMEPRFGQDFSNVRIHTDSQSAQSAADVSARAYTVGNNVVFGAGQYAPNSNQGQQLLAHELAHTVQQNNLNTGMLNRAWLTCETGSDCPTREDGEKTRASKNGLETGTLEAPEIGFIVSHFNIGSSNSAALASDPTWKDFTDNLTKENDRWEIVGFSDCEGGVEANTTLRMARATAVYNSLPPAARTKITRFIAAPLSDCVAGNDTESNRAYNRSIVFRRVETNYTFAPEKIAPTPPTLKKTYTFNITTDGCHKKPFDKVAVGAAVKAAYNRVSKTQCIGSDDLRDKILSEFDGLNIDCEQGDKDSPCGMASRYFTQTVNIYPPALTASCGALESTILHEIIHLTEWKLFGHGTLTDDCEKACFGFGSGNAANCK